MRIAQAFRIFLQSLDISSRMLTEMRLEVDRPEVIIRPDVYQYGMLDAAIPKELVQTGRLAAQQALPEIRKTLSWPNQLLRRLRQASQKFPPFRSDAKAQIKTLSAAAKELASGQPVVSQSGAVQPAAGVPAAALPSLELQAAAKVQAAAHTQPAAAQQSVAAQQSAAAQQSVAKEGPK